MAAVTGTPWARICGWGDANGAYLLTGGGAWVGAYPADASASTTILPVLGNAPTIPASRLEALSPLAGDTTISLAVTLKSSLMSTLGQLWRVVQPVARVVEYVGATDTAITVDDDTNITTGDRWIGGECVGVNSKAANVLSVTRAKLSTYARRHACRVIGLTVIGAPVYEDWPGPADAILEVGRGDVVYWRGVVDDVSVQGSHTATITATSLLSLLRGRAYQPQTASGMTRGSLIYSDDRIIGDGFQNIHWINAQGQRSPAIEAGALVPGMGAAFHSTGGDPGASPTLYVIGENDEWVVVNAEYQATVEQASASVYLYSVTVTQTQDILACGIGPNPTPLGGELLIDHARRVFASVGSVQVACAFTGNQEIETVLERVLGFASDTDATPLATGGLPAAYVDLIPPNYRGTGVTLPSNAGFRWVMPPSIGAGYVLLDWLRDNMLVPLGLGLCHDFGKVRLVDWLARDADLATGLTRLQSVSYDWSQRQTRALPVLAVRTTVSDEFGGVLVDNGVLGSVEVRRRIITNDIRLYVSAAAGVDALNGAVEFAEGGWLMAGRTLDWYDTRAEGLVDTWGRSRPVLNIEVIGPVDTTVVVGSIVTLNTSDGITMPAEDGTLAARASDAPLLVIARQHAQMTDAIALTCVQLQGNTTLARWEPSAKVVSYDGGTGIVTVEANEFTSASFAPTSDAAAFVAAGLVGNDLRLLDANGAFLDTLGLISITGNTFALFDVDVAPSAGDYIVGSSFPPTLTFWADATIYPKRYS